MDMISSGFGVGRRIGIRAAACLGLLLFGVVVGVVLLNVVGVAPSGTEGSPNDPAPSLAARIGAARPGEAVHTVGVVGLLVLGVAGLVTLVIRPAHAGAGLHVLALSIAWLVSVPIVGDPDNYGGQAGLFDPIFVIAIAPSLLAGLLAAPWKKVPAEAVRDVRLWFLVLVASGPIGWYAVDEALMQRNTFPPTADPHHNAHWWVMAIVAIAVVLVVAAHVLWSRWGVGAVAGGVTAAVFGVTALVAPTSASAVRWPWAIAAIVWAIAVIWYVSRSSHR